MYFSLVCNFVQRHMLLAEPGVLCTFVCVSAGSCPNARFCHICHIYSVAGGGGGSKTVSSSYRLRIVTITNNGELNKSVQRREKVCFSAQVRKGDFFVARSWLFCVTV